MKKKTKRIGWILTMVLAVTLIGFAVPGPAEADSLRDHFSVWCDGVAGQLSVALVYSHENGIYADGILHFAPLKDFIGREYNPPVVTVNDGRLIYHVRYDSGFYTSFRESATFYEPTEEGFSMMRKADGTSVTLEDLQPGDYLMAINISAAKGDAYYAGAAFIHVVIPGGSDSLWPACTATPVPPTPSPEPSDR